MRVAADTNRRADVFVRDQSRGITRRVSVGPGGDQANKDSFSPAISADGRYVVFSSIASNLVADDTNHGYDAFLRDRLAGITFRVSLGPGDAQASSNSNAVISGHGRFVVFSSFDTNLVADDTNFYPDVFVRDRFG